jgi:hypothetical protein
VPPYNFFVFVVLFVVGFSDSLLAEFQFIIKLLTVILHFHNFSLVSNSKFYSFALKNKTQGVENFSHVQLSFIKIAGEPIFGVYFSHNLGAGLMYTVGSLNNLKKGRSHLLLHCI